MKLSDIFSLNLNSKGGAKLYRKIMGKYNIPKQDSKQLVKEIRNSSSSNGGANNKYFPKYYTFAVDTDPEMINAISNTFSSLIKYRVFGETIISNSECYFSDTREKNIRAFSYTPMYIYSEFDGYVLIEDFVDYANKSGGTHMTQCLVEITEEEFYKIG